MVSDLFVSQLALFALMWLCLILHWPCGACQWESVRIVQRVRQAWYKHAQTRRQRHEATPQPEKRRCAKY
jgi:hypothetical protein